MGGMLGSSANSRLMRGRFYGAPCEVTLHANPESGEVETIEGCLTASYPTLESLREDFRRFYEAVSTAYGNKGRLEPHTGGHEAYVIPSGSGSIIVQTKQTGMALENEGRYRITFVLQP